MPGAVLQSQGPKMPEVEVRKMLGSSSVYPSCRRLATNKRKVIIITGSDSGPGDCTGVTITKEQSTYLPNPGFGEQPSGQSHEEIRTSFRFHLLHSDAPQRRLHC